MTETIAKVVRKTYLRALPGTCPLAGLIIAYKVAFRKKYRFFELN